ncbi:MAG: c-type cytochrome [Pseudomonadota bacterium]
MKSLRLIAGFTAVLATSVLLTVALADQPSASVPQPTAALIARGNYLVNRVGLCIDCHSPRTEKGEIIPAKHLTGAPIGVAPLAPMPWMPYAPRLAGLPAGFTEAELVHFLMTGERPNGRGNPLPPMPPYRLDRADAEAVAAYLRSLPAE